MKSRIKQFTIILVLMALMPLAGCGWLGIGQPKSDEPAPPPPPSGSYMDFQDVQIPAELKLDRKQSFVYESNSFRAGVLSFTGNMPIVSTLDYFQQHMPGDGWTMLSSFKYHKNILIYTKQDKVCLVMVSTTFGDNHVRAEVWVSPTNPNASVSNSFTMPGSMGMPGNQPGQSGPREETLTYPKQSN